MSNTFVSADGKTHISAGVPKIAGQWTIARTREAFTDLMRSGNTQRQLAAARANVADRMRAEGYVAAATIAVTDRTGLYSSNERARFHGNMDLLAEHGGDTVTAEKKQDGKAYSDRRNTYGNEQASVQMLSKATILQQMEGNKTNSMNIMIRGEIAGVSLPGETYIRVTKTRGGGWLVKSLDGNESPEHKMLHEVVASTLEARRVTGALKGVDLKQKTIDREASTGLVQRYSVNSKFISNIGYIRAAGVGVINIRGTDYFPPMTPETFQKMLNAKSPGEVYNDLVRGNGHADVSVCAHCNGPYVKTGVPHTCATNPVAPMPETARVKSQSRRQRALASASRNILGRNK